MPAKANRQKTRSLNTGSAEWRRLRASILLRDSYTCAVCGRYGNQVDHIDGNSHNNRPSNLQTLCHADHSAKTASEMAGKTPIVRKAISADGSPVGGW